MEKEYLVEFILKHSVKASQKELEQMSIESLVMIKVQIELELAQKFYN